jgi:hypothetical protein
VLRGLFACLTVFAVPVALVSAGPSAAAPPGSQCGVNLTAPQIAQAMRALPPAFSGMDTPWERLR